MKVCLIVAFYFGQRENNQFTRLMETQKRFLKKIKHNLAKIIFVVSDDNTRENQITSDNHFTYFYRQNNGLSFNAWFSVVNHYKNEYTHYIFLEDDYLCLMNNFDEILVNEYNRLNKEYVVNWTQYPNGVLKLTSTIGITTPHVIKQITNYKDTVWPSTKIACMIQFLKSFKSIGCVSKKYSAFPYWGLNNNVPGVWLYDCIDNETIEEYTKRILMGAIQMYDYENDKLIPLCMSHKLEYPNRQ